MPQQGGQGGLPGIGGVSLLAKGGANPGCVGGADGRGGDGGHAGGGLGGSTISVAYVGAQAPSLVEPLRERGKEGEGGPGSDTSLSFTFGAPGRSSDSEALLP